VEQLESQPIITETEVPVAIVQGQSVLSLPVDLYIPPDALRVFLEAFEGPLDLLLYLIKKQNLDILDIPIAEITKQYVEYVEMMHSMQFELAAEYLVMAAMLAEIKSRMLLPRAVDTEAEEEDPRAELVRRLQEYEQFKKAAEQLDQLPREGRDNFLVQIEAPDLKIVVPEPEVDFRDLLLALKDVFSRAEMTVSHKVQLEALSVQDKMVMVLDILSLEHFTEFPKLFNVKEGRLGVVVTFLAILELLKQSLIEIVQNEAFSVIHVKKLAEQVEQTEVIEI
jgi:segregation and condensation protein A